MLIDYDNLPAEIDRLHAEAEDLADLAKRTPEDAGALRKEATSKVRLAARLRTQEAA